MKNAEKIEVRVKKYDTTDNIDIRAMQEICCTGCTDDCTDD